MDNKTALLRAILDSPGDRDLRLMLADVLEEEGQEHSHLLREKGHWEVSPEYWRSPFGWWQKFCWCSLVPDIGWSYLYLFEVENIRCKKCNASGNLWNREHGWHCLHCAAAWSTRYGETFWTEL